MEVAHARAARHCAHTRAQGADQDQAAAASLNHTSFDQNVNTVMEIIQLSKDLSAVHQYLIVTDITDMCLNLSGTKRLGLGNFEDFLDLKMSIVLIRQQESILLFLEKACTCISTGPS